MDKGYCIGGDTTNRIFTGVLFFLLLSVSVASYTLTVTADDSVYAGQQYGMFINFDNETATELVNSTYCTAVITGNGEDILDIQSYDYVLNQPPALITDDTGNAFATFYINPSIYAVDSSYVARAYCKGVASNNVTFLVKPYRQQADVLMNFLTSIGQNPMATILFLLVLIVLAYILKNGVFR